MSLWSVLRGAAAQINPFDHGATYGTYNPPQKKKPDQQQQQPGQFSQSPDIQPQSYNNVIGQTRPSVDFGTLNNTTSVPQQQPQHHSFWNNVSDFVSPVTDAAKGFVHGTQTLLGTPVEAGRMVAADITGNQAAVDAAKNRAKQGINEAVGFARFFPRALAQTEISAYQGLKPGKFDPNAGTITPNNPINRFLFGNEPIQSFSNTGNQVMDQGGSKAKAYGTVGLNALMDALAFKGGIKGVNEGYNESPIKAAMGNDASVNNFVTNSKVSNLLDTTEIPVKQDITVAGGDVNPTPVNVRNLSGNKPLINEVSGDAATANDAASKLAADRQKGMLDRFNSTQEAAPKPNPQIEGVTPRTNKPFQLASSDVKAAQDKIVQDYADVLRNVGEGNGTQLVPDGNGGYTRASNNFRTADTAGKNMTKADWLAEAENQLKNGKAEPGLQQAFNDAANPDVQSQLSQQPPTSPGKPIRVKTVQGIDVNQPTDIPNLPETPGKVRLTTQTNPVKAQSEAIATQTPPVAPVSPVTTAETATAPVAQTAVDASAPAEPFYQNIANDLSTNIKQATQSNKELKQLVSAQKAARAGKGMSAADQVSGEEKLRAFLGSQKGQYADSTGYVGTNHGQDVIDRVINDVYNEPGQLPFNKTNTAKAFQKVFKAGQDVNGEALGAPTKSDIRLVKEFLNRQVGGTVGDSVDSAYADLLANKVNPDTYSTLSNLFGTPRVLMTTGDMSVAGRQGLKLGLQHPIEFAKANARAIKYALNPEAYDQAITDLRNSDLANFAQDNMKVKLPMLAHTDDYYWGDNWVNKIPGVKQVVAASERQYNTVLNDMRLGAAAKQVEKAGGLDEFQRVLFEKSGGDYTKFNKALGKWGEVINNMSGSGDIGNFISKNPGISSALFAPRNLAAKFNTFNPLWYAKIAKDNPAAAIYAAKTMGTYLTTVGATLYGLKKAGATVEFDPRSSDFGTIKLGNTRIDLTGGDRTMATFLTRMFLGLGRLANPNTPDNFKNSTTGDTSWKNAGNITANFLSNKVSPVAGLVHQLFGFKPSKDGTGITDAYGNPLNTNSLWATLGNLTVPMDIQDAVSAYKDSGSLAKAAGVGAASFFGAGANTYGSVATKDQPAANDKVATEFSNVQTDNVRNLLTKDEQKLYDQAFSKNAYNMSTSDQSKLNSAIKKTAPKLLENGDYQTHSAVLQHEMNILEQDPSTTDATLGKIQVEVNRDGVLQKNKVPYSDLKLYEDTSLSEWRAMGNSKSDSYDPATYNKLKALDDALAAGKAGYAKDDPTKHKYTAKSAGSGTSKKGKTMSTTFGTLKSSGGSGGPRVKQYQTANFGSTSGIPVISRVEPNIVHKIGRG